MKTNSINNFFTQQNCPVCKSPVGKTKFSVQHTQSDVLKLLGAKDENPEVDIIQCDNCPHFYMNPIISDENLNRYYSQVNSEFYLRRKSEISNINAKEYADYTKQIQSKISSGRILEIGCGKGFLLKTLQDNGYECFGVEPSPMAYDHAKNTLHLNVENKFLQESRFFYEKFDVVVLTDVVEHISNIQLFMQQVTHVLKPGGYIFIGTGDMNSWNARFAGPNWGYFVSWEHVSFFTVASMKKLLEDWHFANISIKKTSLQHKPLQNVSEVVKNFAKKLINPFLRSKYYHGICFDHMIAIAKYKG